MAVTHWRDDNLYNLLERAEILIQSSLVVLPDSRLSPFQPNAFQLIVMKQHTLEEIKKVLEEWKDFS